MSYQLKINPKIKQQFPEYRALIIYASGLTNGPSTAYSLDLLRNAERQARQSFGEEKPANHPHIAAWREAYKSWGAKPSKYPCSVEALLSRTLKGNDLPGINQIVDVYNAVSLRHVLPVGGEDWDTLSSDLELKFAVGNEPFEIRQEAAKVVTYPEPGEIIWADSSGTTCRMWNWRQCLRTQLTEQTQNIYFVLDCLPPFSIQALLTAGDELMSELKIIAPGCVLEQVILGQS